MGQRKMVDLLIEETSGVDHPAHLHEGWLVIKSAAPSEVWQVLDGVGPDKETGMDTLEKALQRLAEVEAENAVLKAAKPAPADDAPTDEDALLKSLDDTTRAYVEGIKKSADEALAKAQATEDDLRKAREAAADKDAEAFLKSLEHLTLADVEPADLRKMREFDPALAEKIEKALVAVNGQADTAALFKEMGATGHGSETSAYGRLDAMAKAAVADGKADTYAEAFTKAVEANPDLYVQYTAEKKG